MILWRVLLFVAAVLLSLVSVALPAVQWASIPVDILGQWLAGGTAVALGICKIGFFPLAWHHITQKVLFPGVTLFLFAVLFLVINVDATADFLTQQSNGRNVKTNTENLEVQRLNNDLKTLNRRIETVQEIIERDGAGGFRARAIKNQNVLDKLAVAKQQLAQRIDIAKQAAQNSQRSAFGIKLGNHPGDSNKGFSGELVVSLCIHLGCVLSVLSCGAWAPRVEVASPVKNTYPNAPARNKTQLTETSELFDNDNEQPETLNAEQQRLFNEIIAGVYGNEPSVRDLISGKPIKGGYKRISPVFKRLVEAGHLQKVSGRYQLTQTTI